MIGVHSGKFHGNQAPVRSSSERKPVTPGESKVPPCSAVTAQTKSGCR